MPAKRSLTLSLTILMLASVYAPTLAMSPGLQAEKPANGPAIKTAQGWMVPYTQAIPGTDISFEMIPVSGGVVEVGAAPNDDEAKLPASKPMKVQVGPYWIAKREVSWAEYWRFMDMYAAFEKIAQLRGKVSSDDEAAAVINRFADLKGAVDATPDFVDGVTAPTPLYEPPTTYKAGERPELPAVTMSPYAAKQYTKWMSAITGAEYRLPSEAEWEHAALAGGTGPYGVGEDGKPISETSLSDYAWSAENSRADDDSEKFPHPVGEKKPNAWGLHDMLGNAAEWVLDEPRENPPNGKNGEPLSWKEAIAWPTEQYPRIAKGGSCKLGPADCRVVSRLESDDSADDLPDGSFGWKYSDPNYPLSPWWFTEEVSRGVGFRVVRPLEPMSGEVKTRVWEIDHEDIRDDVLARLEEGRGKLQRVDRELPSAVNALQEEAVQELLD